MAHSFVLAFLMKLPELNQPLITPFNLFVTYLLFKCSRISSPMDHLSRKWLKGSTLSESFSVHEDRFLVRTSILKLIYHRVDHLLLLKPPLRRKHTGHQRNTFTNGETHSQMGKTHWLTDKRTWQPQKRTCVNAPFWWRHVVAFNARANVKKRTRVNAPFWWRHFVASNFHLPLPSPSKSRRNDAWNKKNFARFQLRDDPALKIFSCWDETVKI